MKKIAVCMPCYGRPDRTKRAIECILSQDMTDWVAFVIGDGCPDFEHLLRDNRKLGSNSWESRAKAQGSVLYIFNASDREGGYGYALRNFVMGFLSRWGEAQYLIFLDNDDLIEKNHFSNYLSGIDGTNNDLVYFDSNCQFAKYIRNTELRDGQIGHAEIIIRVDFLRNHSEIQQSPEYGHDWKFIAQLIASGARHEKSNNQPTYNVMGAGELREANID